MDRNILVTGGAGYIGSHACKALAVAGYTPVSLDNLVAGHRAAVKWGPFVAGDLADESLLADTLKKYRITGVMHFAAYASVPESIQHPGKYYLNNVCNSIRLLDATVAAGVGTFVFSSSCAIYGNPENIPISETHPHNPVNPYGDSKLCIERALKWYSRAYGLSVAALRYFNAAGADADGETGEWRELETHLVPLAIQAALGHRTEVKVFGTDYPTPDGSAIRDYIHVTDLADAHVLALKKLESGKGNLFLNLGTGGGASVQEVISVVESISGVTLKRKLEGRRAGDPAELVAATKLARNELAWQPVLSDLNTIVESALRWHKGPGFA